MKVLIDSGNCVTQNRSGGVQTKIFRFVQYANSLYETKLFDKWSDQIENYDILHIFMAGFDEYSIVKVAKSKKVPVVVSAIVPSKETFKIFASRVINRWIPIRDPYWMKARILQMADIVIAETEQERRFVAKNFKVSQEKIVVIPNGVEVPREDIPKELFAERTGIDGRFILQVGRFDSNKNQLNTIKAVNGTNMQLVLIGGPDKADPGYFEKCKRIANENVHFLGWVDHDDPLLQAAYKAAQVVILPSYKEIFGNAMFEGGINGANIVVTNVLPIKEWGFAPFVQTIDPNSYEDIREKLNNAYTKNKDNTLSGLIKRDYSWETVIQAHADLYRGILKNDR